MAITQGKRATMAKTQAEPSNNAWAKKETRHG